MVRVVGSGFVGLCTGGNITFLKLSRRMDAMRTDAANRMRGFLGLN